MNSDYFVINMLIPLEQAIFSREGRYTRNDLWFITIIAQFTQVGLQQIGLKNMACATCHINSIRAIWSE
jgi:hypothetical protein